MVDRRVNNLEKTPDKRVPITPGYSRDHRPDLNQVILNLISENTARMPLLMQIMSGNQMDNTSTQFYEGSKKRD